MPEASVPSSLRRAGKQQRRSHPTLSPDEVIARFHRAVQWLPELAEDLHLCSAALHAERTVDEKRRRIRTQDLPRLWSAIGYPPHFDLAMAIVARVPTAHALPLLHELCASYRGQRADAHPQIGLVDEALTTFEHIARSTLQPHDNLLNHLETCIWHRYAKLWNGPWRPPLAPGALAAVIRRAIVAGAWHDGLLQPDAPLASGDMPPSRWGTLIQGLEGSPMPVTVFADGRELKPPWRKRCGLQVGDSPLGTEDYSDLADCDERFIDTNPHMAIVLHIPYTGRSLEAAQARLSTIWAEKVDPLIARSPGANRSGHPSPIEKDAMAYRLYWEWCRMRRAQRQPVGTRFFIACENWDALPSAIATLLQPCLAWAHDEPADTLEGRIKRARRRFRPDPSVELPLPHCLG